MNPELTRRDLFHAGLCVGAAALLAGCQSGGGTVASDESLPGPLYPDMEPLADPSRRPAAATPPTLQRIPNQNAAPPAGTIPRTQWTSAKPMLNRQAIPMNGIGRITVHHDSIPSGDIRSTADAARRLESIRRTHIGNGWVDIGYHFAIDPSGRVWEARPLYLQGAHVKNQNEHNLGVMLLGNFNTQQPTPQAQMALRSLLTDSMRRYNVSVYRVYGHRELGQTACPGSSLFAYLNSLRAGPLRA